MNKHILKIIWTQRKSNGWIFAELLVVMGALWFMADSLWVDFRTYYSPLGYDITDTWRFKLSKLPPEAPDYVPDSLVSTDDAHDLLRLMDQIRMNEQVENICVCYWSAPYSQGNSWRSLFPVDGDTTVSRNRSFHVRYVSPDYFDLFRIVDTDSRSITSAVKGVHKPLVLSRDGELAFFPGKSAKGREVSFTPEYSEIVKVVAISVPQRDDEFSRSENCFFMTLDGEDLVGAVNRFSVQSAELCVRMKQPMNDQDMRGFLADMDQRLTVNNLYVHGVRSIEDFRSDRLSFRQGENKKRFSLMLFLLINVFFGVVGTFWLRVQHRRGEIGIRIALGSSKKVLKRHMYLEGLILLLLTLPIVIFFAANMVYIDKLDTFRIPLSAGRFLITFGISYLVMAGMICLGIWYPVRKAIQMPPAEALHYE